MAVPGVFAPVVTEDRILSDGGMMRNVPVDIARELCGEVVIVSNLESPPPGPEDLASALALIGRSIDVMIDANVKAQMATLTERDVAIHVQMGDLGTGDFHRVAEAIPKGEVAARAVADELRRYSVPEAQYRAWRESVTSQPPTRMMLADVRITGTERVNADYLLDSMNLRPGDEATTEQIAEETRRIYALGDFERVEYKLTGDRDNSVLEIGVTEKVWGPDFLSFDLGLHASSGGDLSFALRAEHLRTWVNESGGEWHTAVQFGRKSLVKTSFYQPLDDTVMPYSDTPPKPSSTR
jgi:NTE family protein